MFKVLLSFFVATSAFAGYNSMKVCGNRALVIDEKVEVFAEGRGQQPFPHRYYQFVLTDKNVVENFVAKGALEPYLINNKGELVRELARNAQGQFYSIYDKGRTMTFDVYPGAVHLQVFSSVTEGSHLIADFYFNDCN